MAQGVQRGVFEKFDASAYKIGIVVGQFNKDICDDLLTSAFAKCEEYNITKDAVTVVRVPGSVEIPVILKAMAETKRYNCLVSLGVIIRGDTPHFDYVAKIVTEGVLKVIMDYGIPVGFGVLTCENHEQATARLHVGGESMEAALQCTKMVESLL